MENNQSKFTLLELAKRVDGELVGEGNLLVDNLVGIDQARSGSLVYVGDVKKLEAAEKSLASAVLAPFDADLSKKPGIRAKNVKLAFAKLLRLFHPADSPTLGIHPTAVVDKTAVLGKEITIGPYSVVGENVKLGEQVQIGPFVLLEENVVVGDHTVIRSHANILRGVKIGRGCLIYEGVVIGSDGFGYATDEHGKHWHVPQVGTVILEDEVEVGANSTIDRATLGITRIGRGTKIDNLVQIAHNCQIGENCIIAAMVGIAGSTSIGDASVVGGRAGIRDHLQIGDHVTIAGGSSVWHNLKSGSFVSGTPARNHRENLEVLALLHQLPGLLKRLEALEKQ